MTTLSTFIGTIDQAPEAVQQKVGSLIPRAEGEHVTVCYAVRGTETALEEIVRFSKPASRLFVYVESHAELELTAWLETASMHVVEVIVEAEARCNLVHVNAATGTNDVSVVQRMQLHDGAVANLSNIALSSAPLTHDVSSLVVGANAESNIDCVFYAKHQEKQFVNARNVFNGPNGGGEINMRGIAEGKGHAECKGLIEIGLQGGGTNTYLTQEVLMLDATAKVDAIPALEIKTNDVKASHSATVARVTEEDLFYFGARGIAPEEARRLFVLGFLGSVTEKVNQVMARQLIVEEIERKFEQ